MFGDFFQVYEFALSFNKQLKKAVDSYKKGESGNGIGAVFLNNSDSFKAYTLFCCSDKQVLFRELIAKDPMYIKLQDTL
eukprot:Pgem_evm1s17259